MSASASSAISIVRQKQLNVEKHHTMFGVARATFRLRARRASAGFARSFGVLEDRTSYRSLDPNAGKGSVLTPNKGKNLKLQAVLFDYDVLSMVHDWDEDEYEQKTKEYTRKTGLKNQEIRRVEELVLQKDATLLLKQEMRDGRTNCNSSCCMLMNGFAFYPSSSSSSLSLLHTQN